MRAISAEGKKTVEDDFGLGPWLVQPQLNSISDKDRNDERHLEPKVMQVLVYMAEHAGEVVPKEGLIKAVWPDVFVTDDALARCISELRRALEDDAREPRFIQTIVKGGYRLIAEVKPVEEAEAPKRSASVPAIPRRQLMLAAGLTILALLSAAGYLGWRWFRSPPASSRGRVMLLVLPFQSLSGDPEQEYFSDGLTEEMITQLAGMQPGRLGVIALTTAMHYKKAGKTIDQIGRELGVDYVIEGSVRREQNRVRIAAQLIQVTDQAQLWAQSYDREVSGILAVQTEIAQAIAPQIRLRLTAEEQARLRGARLVDPVAYEFLLRARYRLNVKTREAVGLAIQYYRQAVQADPLYAQGYAELSMAYTLRHALHMARPGEGYEEARAAALRALELDRGLAESHLAFGAVASEFQWNWSVAEQEFRRALDLDPNSVASRWRYSEYLSCMGRHEEALAQVLAAEALDPLSPGLASSSAYIYFMAGRYHTTVERARRAVELTPGAALPHLYLSWAYAEQGRLAEAIAETETAMRLDAPPDSKSQLARLHAMAGRPQQARALLRQVRDTSSEYNHRYYIAMAHAYLGERDAALGYLQQSYERRERAMRVLKVDPRFNLLRNEPRFQDLLRRMKFTP
jgi:TolB-like protein/DNA-binding winged helix-turn-helix (wHTH) protein